MPLITEHPLVLEEVVRSVVDPGAGAIDVFIGTTRNLSHGRAVVSLEYEAYGPMAEKVMGELESEAKRRWNIRKTALVHRIGRVEVEAPSVIIAVSSAHRAEAFEACRFLIDRLKNDVPIWKREHFADGTVEWSMAQHVQGI